MSNDKIQSLYVLLIGIDGYLPPLTPLTGCVNDIEAVENLLRTKLAIPGTRIRKLVARNSDQQPPTQPPDSAQLPTLPTRSNIIAALQCLAREPVDRGDGVLIYYAGHGNVEWLPDAGMYFEGLAPVDREEAGLLYDVELNLLLQAIAERCHDLTVVLDCCHAAGATRTGQDEIVRCLPVRILKQAPWSDLVGAHLRMPDHPPHGGEPAVDYTVLAACHADEQAGEMDAPQQPSRRHGVFTWSLLSVLSDCDRDTLAAIRFMDILEPLKAKVTRRSRNQHPWLLGPTMRRLFGGPWKQLDAGFAVRQNPDNSYFIGGGLLAGLGKGCLLAVYGDEPARLPALETEEERAARIGILSIDTADLASAVAHRPAGQPDFAVPTLARARLLKRAAPDPLRVAVGAAVPQEIAEHLRSTAAVAGFALTLVDDPMAEVRIEQRRDGSLEIADECYPPASADAQNHPAPLALIPKEDPLRMAGGLRAALAHYAQYVIPIRLCRQASVFAHAAPLVQLLTCRGLSSEQLSRLALDPSSRREAARGPHGHYLLHNGEPACILVRNLTGRSHFVSLLVCSLEGQVQILDTNVLVASKGGHLFWSDNVHGSPFVFARPPGNPWGIDRLIVIATEQRGVDLSMLGQPRTLQQAIDDAMAGRSVVQQSPRQPAQPVWTARQTLVEIR